MRRFILLSVFALLVSNASAASAQRRGGIGPGLGRGSLRQRQSRGFGFNRRPSVLPYGFGYLDGGSLPYDPAEPVVMVQQPPPPVVIQPPREVHPVITEYVRPAADTSVLSTPSGGEPQPFGIVLKDGTIRSAKAVVVSPSNDTLQYVDPEERHMRLALNDVDRDATRKLNIERNLHLWLPAAPDPGR